MGTAEICDIPTLSHLRAMLDLIDIGGTGRASQSSLSKWSRPDDAQNAVGDVDRDYAFHTGAEDAPWWSLTFEQPQSLQYLVLENRRNVRFRHLADRLTIEAEIADKTVTLHDAVQRFGTAHDDSALVIPLADVPPVARITITAHTGGGYFHLSRVHAFATGAPANAQRSKGAQDEPLYFIANRTDGFGERLRAVLNAMVAADHFDGKMLLGWQTRKGEEVAFHAINHAEQTFAPSFLQDRLSSAKAIERLGKITADAVTFGLDGRIDRRPDMDAIVLDQHPIGRQLGALAHVSPKPRYRKAFDEIRFTPALEMARSMARDASIGDDCIAVHLRAGDIIYGKYRTTGGFTSKAIAYPLVDALIAKTCEAGGNVIIFGQDAALCQHLSARDGVRMAADYAIDGALDDLQSVLFEICLMSRCRQIYSGSSGFAVLASWIGEAQAMTINRAFSDREIVDIILTGTDAIADGLSDLQKAYANFYALHRYPNRMSDAERRIAIDRCLAFDPENVLYRIIDAAHLYSEGQEAEAEARLDSFSRVDVGHDLGWSLARTVHFNMIRHHLPAFKAPAEAGYPMATLCLALREQALGNMGEAARYAALYRGNKGNLDTPLEARLAV